MRRLFFLASQGFGGAHFVDGGGLGLRGCGGPGSGLRGVRGDGFLGVGGGGLARGGWGVGRGWWRDAVVDGG